VLINDSLIVKFQNKGEIMSPNTNEVLTPRHQ